MSLSASQEEIIVRQYVFQPAGEAENDAIHAGMRAYNRKFVPDTGDLSLAVKDADGRVGAGKDQTVAHM